MIDQTIVFHTITLGKKVKKALGHKTYPHSLGHSQASAILFIAQHGMISQREIASHLHIEPASMVILINELVRLNLAKRASHETDRRRNKITLTAKGKKTVDGIMNLTEKLDSYLRSQLTDQEVKNFLKTTGKLSTYLDGWKGGEHALPYPKRTLENGNDKAGKKQNPILGQSKDSWQISPNIPAGTIPK